MATTAHRALRPTEWRALAILGLPTFALALAITTVDIPAGDRVGLRRLDGRDRRAHRRRRPHRARAAVVVGAWSDRLRRRIGGRLPFVLGATPPLLAALALLGFVNSIATAAIVVAAFFVAYYVTYEPYRALYPDMVADEIAGRAQSTQALFRGAATCLALIAGGLLISIANPVPFLAAAVVTGIAMAAFAWSILRRGVPDQDDDDEPESPFQTLRALRAAVADEPALKAFPRRERALGALPRRAEDVRRALHHARAGAQRPGRLARGGRRRARILAASPLSGKLADRVGRPRVMQAGLWVYGVGLLVPLLTTRTWLIAAAVPLVAFCGGVIMTLPYALLMPLMPEGRHGALSGFYSLSRGIGTALGPLLAGIAISVAREPLSSTDGYAAMWAVCAAATLASIPLVRRLRDDAD